MRDFMTMKAAAESDLAIGGAELAAQAFRAGLVDECHVFLDHGNSACSRNASQDFRSSPFWPGSKSLG